MIEVLKVFEPEQAAELLEQARALPYVDGKSTARGSTVALKNNRQAGPGAGRDALTQRIVKALRADPGLTALALPRFFSVPIFNLAAAGEHYGEHIDQARMPGLHGWPMRTDLSYTLFLAPPDSYDGGELRIRLPLRPADVKLPAGHLVVYDSALPHAVQPVTRGERYGMAGWIESLVHSARQRELLYRLSRHCAAMTELRPADAALHTEMSVLLQGFIKELAG